jgi:hypothetical protein
VRSRDQRNRKGGPDRAERIGDIIERLFRSRAFSKEPDELTEIKSCWSEVVGEELATGLFPERISGSTLWIKVNSPALLYELKNFGRKSMLARFERILPGRFSDIRFCQ